MAKQRKKYRPGIDDPPVTLLVWLGAMLGVTTAVAFVRTMLRRKKG